MEHSDLFDKIENILRLPDSIVDSQSKLDGTCHVFSRDGAAYSCVLEINIVDDVEQKAYHYKLQVLHANSAENEIISDWLFTRWGPDADHSKVDKFDLAESACEEFENIFQDLTCNEWKSRPSFKQLPGMFLPFEIACDVTRKASNTNIAFELPREVEELMKVLFNIDDMHKTLDELQFEVKRMPLESFGVQRLNVAMYMLNKIKVAIISDGTRKEFAELSEKFFNLIPHKKSPTISSITDVENKLKMVSALLAIQSAYAMMQPENTSSNINCFDTYYIKLKAVIEQFDIYSDEMKMIKEYAENSRDLGRKITIEEAFKITRHSERDQSAEFSKWHNRYLLWHGSSRKNFASIIAEGLKILPSVNGKFHGRGIYFADRIDKSPNTVIDHENVPDFLCCARSR